MNFYCGHVLILCYSGKPKKCFTLTTLSVALKRTLKSLRTFKSFFKKNSKRRIKKCNVNNTEIGLTNSKSRPRASLKIVYLNKKFLSNFC